MDADPLACGRGCAALWYAGPGQGSGKSRITPDGQPGSMPEAVSASACRAPVTPSPGSRRPARPRSRAVGRAALVRMAAWRGGARVE